MALSPEYYHQMEQTTPEQFKAMANPSTSIHRICEICDTVAAIDDELQLLRHKISQLDEVMTVIRSSWKMDANAIRSTARHDNNTARLERIEALQADIEDLTTSREQLINEATTLFNQLKTYEKPYAALVLNEYCGVTV